MSGPVEPTSETQFGLGKSIAFSLILILFILGALEGGIRVWVYFFRDAYERFDSSTGTFALVPGQYRDNVRVNSEGFVGRELAPDTKDLFRIYTLGDSCTWGGGGEHDTYPAILDELLVKQDRNGVRYEVVNAGVQGLNSELALNRLKAKGPQVHPEIVTIYIGWNDLMKVDPSAQGTSTRWAGVARAIDQLWLVKGLRKLLFFQLRPSISPPRTGPESRTGRFKDFQPSVYEANLRAIIAEVRKQGAQPVLLTLPTVVREDMTVDDVHRAGVMFPYFPSANAVGDLLDLLDAYNRTIHRVAAEEQVPLVDLAKTFQAMPDVRPYFYDTMHMTTSGREIVAKELAAALERDHLLEPTTTSTTSSSRAAPAEAPSTASD